jgi:hypothetical protein
MRLALKLITQVQLAQMAQQIPEMVAVAQELPLL